MLTKIDAKLAVYKRAVRREGRFWRGQNDDPVRTTQLPRLCIKYRQRRETGTEDDRYAALAKLGPFEDGLSIGCGSANTERELLKRGIVKRFTFIDISEESLQMLERALPKAHRGRVTLLRQDLNFIKLQPNTYDFIFCSAVLHHLINLEHVLLELNASLTPGGVLFVDEFIGENRFQSSDERIALLNAVGAIAQKKTGIKFTPVRRTSRRWLINLCPFEAVRSEDVLPLLRQIFKNQTLREETYGAVAEKTVDLIDLKVPQHDEAVAIIIAFDELIQKHDLLQPQWLVGIYRKNPAPPKLRVKRWSSSEVRHHLPVQVLDERFSVYLAGVLRRTIGQGALYQSIRALYFALRH